MFGLSKGTIEIQLDKNDFKKGETIKGKVVLQMKKTVTAKELTIRLIANQKIRQGIGTNRSTRTMKVHDFKLNLDNEKEYPANQPLIYPFSIQIPAKFAREQMIPEQLGNTLGKVAKVAQMMTGSRSTTYWYLIANLNVPGMFNDVKKKIQINVVD